MLLRELNPSAAIVRPSSGVLASRCPLTQMPSDPEHVRARGYLVGSGSSGGRERGAMGPFNPDPTPNNHLPKPPQGFHYRVPPLVK